MKKFVFLLCSTWLIAILLFIFVISIASATFIENSFGTVIARALVYNAGWFNLLLFLIAVCLLCIIIKKRLYRKEKIPQFVIHFAFIIILIGAGLTRFFGYEGVMAIREGSGSDKLLTNKDYGFGLDGSRFYPTVFEGNEEAPADIETIEAWKSVGISENKICKLPASENWWAPGPVGPCRFGPRNRPGNARPGG